MKSSSIIFEPIGIIHSDFKNVEGIPIQPVAAEGIKGKVILYKKFADGLKNLEGFSHIILIYHFHLSKGYSLRVIPFLHNKEQGIFATRAPKRPNQIGVSVVKLEKINQNIIEVSSIDVVDGTPLLDIKPYVSSFDNVKSEKSGWLNNKVKNVRNTKADKRFKG